MTGGFIVGVAIVGLLAVIAYALLSGGDGGPDVELVRITATATANPTATATPVATLNPTMPPPTPSPEPEQPTPIVIIVREDAPPPTVETAPPAQESLPPTPVPAEELNRMCSDERALLALYDMVVPYSASRGLPLPPEDIMRDLAESQTFVTTNCRGIGLTPVPSQGLTTTCSQAGELRGILGQGDPDAQQTLLRLD